MTRRARAWLRGGIVAIVGLAGCRAVPPECSTIHDPERCRKTPGCEVHVTWTVLAPGPSNQFAETSRPQCEKVAPR